MDEYGAHLVPPVGGMTQDVGRKSLERGQVDCRFSKSGFGVERGNGGYG